MAGKLVSEAGKWPSEIGKWSSETAKWTSWLETCIFPRFLGVGGREPAFFLGFLMVREAAGGREQGRMTLEFGFAGRWGGL